MRYRDNLQLTYDIIKPLRDGPIQRSKLMTMAGTSYTLYKIRLDIFIRNNLIEEMDDFDKSVQITPLGLEFIDHFERIMELLKE